MATWNGKPRKFNLERFDPKNFGHSHYEDVVITWEYGTVSDSLRITQKDSLGENHQSYGKDEAVALLVTMADWFGKYEGKAQLKELLKDILEE